MDAHEFFDEYWPDIARIVRGRLCVMGVSVWDVDDLVQETALRLLGAWERLDLERGPGAYAWTIAMNLRRDVARRHTAIPVAEIPDQSASYDILDTVHQRAEVARVGRALGQLHPRDATALRQTLVDPTAPGRQPLTDATRVARMRARRTLVRQLSARDPVAAQREADARRWSRPPADQGVTDG